MNEEIFILELIWGEENPNGENNGSGTICAYRTKEQAQERIGESVSELREQLACDIECNNGETNADGEDDGETISWSWEEPNGEYKEGISVAPQGKPLNSLTLIYDDNEGLRLTYKIIIRVIPLMG